MEDSMKMRKERRILADTCDKCGLKCLLLCTNQKRGTMIHRIIFLCLLTFVLSACTGKQKQEAEPEKKELAFTLPEVPVMLQSAEDRLAFVIQHYWEHFDFKDTAYIHAPEVTEQALVNYVDLLQRVPMEFSDSCLTKTLTAAGAEEKMFNYFAETLRRYLFDPNSPIRDEELYEPVGRFLATSPLVDEATQSRARHDLKLIGMNRVGALATDFVYTLPSGAQKRMHDLRSPYTLLLFYNPDCHGCAETLAAMKSSPVLNRPDMMKQIKILAFYPDEDKEVWDKHQDEIPSSWINSYDKDLTVLTKELYDLKAMPTLYLLDKDKKVLLKDVSVGTVEKYFENK